MTAEPDPPEENPAELPPLPEERATFQHPEWMVGIVLVLACVSLFAGLFGNPVWLLIGSPFIVTLLIFLWARFVHRS